MITTPAQQRKKIRKIPAKKLLGRLKKPPYSKNTRSAQSTVNGKTLFLIARKNTTTFTTKAHKDGFFSAWRFGNSQRVHNQEDHQEYFHYYPWGQCPTDKKALLTNNMPKQHISVRAAGLGRSTIPRRRRKTLLTILFPKSGGRRDQKPCCVSCTYPPFKRRWEIRRNSSGCAHEDINLTDYPAIAPTSLAIRSRPKMATWWSFLANFGNANRNIGDMLQEASGGYFPSTVTNRPRHQPRRWPTKPINTQISLP